MDTFFLETYRKNPPFEIAKFIEAMIDRNLYLRASTLHDILKTSDEVTFAIERAMQICTQGGVPVREHFKIMYVADDVTHTVQREWQLSRLAYYLTLINGSSFNPIVGYMQLKMIKKYILDHPNQSSMPT